MVVSTQAFHLTGTTTTHKTPELVQLQISVMNNIAKKHLLTAGKDISNPGILGTLGMLLEASEVGATVELEKIPRNSTCKLGRMAETLPRIRICANS